MNHPVRRPDVVGLVEDFPRMLAVVVVVVVFLLLRHCYQWLYRELVVQQHRLKMIHRGLVLALEMGWLASGSSSIGASLGNCAVSDRDHRSWCCWTRVAKVTAPGREHTCVR